MRKMLSLLITVLLLTGLLPAMSALGETTRYKSSFFDVFDTYSEIIVYAQSEADAQTVLQNAHAELLAYHQLFDIYNTYDGINNLKTVNDQAGQSPVTVDQRIMDLLVFAKDMYTQTDGRMNIAMGSVLSIWHDYRTAGIDDPDHAALPGMEALQAAAAYTDITHLILDDEANTVFLEDAGMRLDVGAVAKGYAVERVAQQMIANGVTSALLSIGGNVRAIGTRGDGTSWRVSVQNPDLTAADQTLTTVDLMNLSLVTSGSYQRYYTVDGQTYHHIIEPDTLMPAAYLWAVSVVTEDSGLADALSTALFTLSIEEGQALLQRFPGVEVLWVTLDGTLVRSEGFSTLTAEEIAAP